jgi:hypothetical protein
MGSGFTTNKLGSKRFYLVSLRFARFLLGILDLMAKICNDAHLSVAAFLRRGLLCLMLALLVSQYCLPSVALVEIPISYWNDVYDPELFY